MKKLLVSLGMCLCAVVYDANAKSNYVVIGAFASKANAEKFTAAAVTNSFDARFDINTVRNLFYVYVLRTDNWKQASAEALRLRAQSAYTDAWVFIGDLGATTSEVSADMNPVTAVKIEQVEDMAEKLPAQETNSEDSVTAAAPPSIAVIEPVLVATNPDAPSKSFYFNLYRSTDKVVVDGEVNLFNLENQRLQSTFKANGLVTVKAPNKSGDVRLECDIVGYKKVVQLINYKNPAAAEGVSIQDDVITVPFELVRLQTGDFAILYNVFFFKDAAIMRPESKYDLDGLLAMMKENPNYKIRIHGHTNGNSAGKIIEPGEDRNLFSLTNGKEGRGSAKKLSEERASVIREYLVKEGIEVSRMEVKAWGGKKPIYDHDHTQAGANVRVEIEVIQQ